MAFTNFALKQIFMRRIRGQLMDHMGVMWKKKTKKWTKKKT